MYERLRRISSWALAALAATFAFSSAAQAQIDIQVCNRSYDSAYVAVSYIPVGSNSWTNRGWWTVRPGNCTIIGRTNNRVFYTRAEVVGDGSRGWWGDHRLCASYPGPYEFWSPRDGVCRGSQRSVGFRTLRATSSGTFTWNLRP